LNPGLLTLAAYRSASIDSKVDMLGKYAKNLGCCQWVIPGVNQSTMVGWGVKEVRVDYWGGGAKKGEGVTLH
jgi:hypothetical protein